MDTYWFSCHYSPNIKNTIFEVALVLGIIRNLVLSKTYGRGWGRAQEDRENFTVCGRMCVGCMQMLYIVL